MKSGGWDQLHRVFVDRRRNWNGKISYMHVLDGFPKKNITRMPDDAIRRYIDVTSKRRWLYWGAASKSWPKWSKIWR